MATVVPTVLAEDIHEYNRLVELLDFAPRLHLDVMDGQFARPHSIETVQLHWPEEKHVDIHMMVDDPLKHIETLVAKQPQLVILHAESETFSDAFSELKAHNMSVGVALLQETTPEDVPELVDADHCLIFGGKLGSYGGQADLGMLKKVAVLTSINPAIEIGWDGGANEANITQLVQSGVSVVNVGSAVQNTKNPEEAYATLVEKVKL